MKIKKQKKGFTIVELVIVIAIIGILSAILIPTFAGLVKRANIAADTALVKDLNTVLATDKAVNGKHTTMHDALEVTKESGLDVSKINAKIAKNEIMWDSANDVFCYLEDGKIKYVPETELEAKDVKTYQYFVIRDVDSAEDISTEYSTYLRSSTLAEISTTKGIDVGDVSTITAITYNGSASAQDVVIRTNSAKTSLTVNAASDTVNHYGAAGSADIIAVANASYHENGSVAFMEISKGRVALENTSEVKHIHINKEIISIDNSGNKTKKDNKFDKVIVSIQNGVQAPAFSRDEVSIADIISATESNKGILIVEIEKGNNNSDFIYLYQQGLLEQIRVTTGSSTNSGANVVAKEIDATAKKGSDVTLEVHTASLVVDLANNIKSGSSVTQDQIDNGTVDETDIEETGLTIETKNEKKDTLVGTAIIEEEKEIDQGKCLHNWFTKTIEIETTCLIGGLETQECSICHNKQTVTTDPLGHDLIGIYCNRCKHPVAFVDEIDDYTVNDPESKKMSVSITLNNILSPDAKLYLDTAYSFKAFPDMSNRVLDNEKLYKLDLETFTFTEKQEGDSDELCFTAQGIYEFFSTWYCDYYVSFSEGIDAYSCGLGGYYESFGRDIGFLAPDLGEGKSIPGNEEIPLLGSMFSGGVSNMTYEEIITSIGEFKCGFFNLSEDNVGKIFTVKLRLLNPKAKDYSEPGLVENTDLGISLPNYIDVAITNYVIQAPGEENLQIVSEFLANPPEYAENF